MNLEEIQYIVMEQLFRIIVQLVRVEVNKIEYVNTFSALSSVN